jgi:class 3 adenylate cyclase
MAGYDYQKGKERVESILDNTLTIIENYKIPSDENFTFSNAYYGWVTGIFVDIRNSSKLFSNGDKELISKMIRSFTSEVIEILRKDSNLREIGIRGDCVYGIFTTPTNEDVDNVAQKSFWINTFIKMLNKLLSGKGFPEIQVGIGVSTDKELVVKAGRKGVGINNSVWIGDAVTKASNLSSLGNKKGYRTILISEFTYNCMIDIMKNRNAGKNVESWFRYHTISDFGNFFDANIIKEQFDNWIDAGMP